jgi:GTP cyclohydrolase I
MVAGTEGPSYVENLLKDSEECMRQILHNEGIEDEEVLERTPERWVAAFRAMQGTGADEWDFTTFDSPADDMVIVGPIQFASLCAHHLLPFFGEAFVAYIPQGQIVGLSKLPRAVKTAALGLWAQEELCEEIMTQLERRLKPKGVAVTMRAEHTCMSVRGVKAPGVRTTTSSMSGVFRENGNNARAEFLSLIK